MEGNAITNENLIISTYETEHILSLKMMKGMNDHAQMYLLAVIPEEHAEEYVYITTASTPITVGYLQENGGAEVLFRGAVTNIQVSRQGNVFYMEVYAKSNTYVMDIAKRSRSFQNTGMTVHQLIREVMAAYTNSDCIINIPDEPTGRLIVQYRETDWEFLRRVLTHYGAALIPDVIADKIAFYAGISEPEEIYEADPYHYTVTKSVNQYMQIKENQWPEAAEIDFTVFELRDYRMFQAGDYVNLGGKCLAVESAVHVLGDGILNNTYRLRRKEGLKGLEEFNPQIVGASVTGKVSGVARDKVMVDLEIDEADRAAYWFPYSTMSASPDGSGWYCMPEKGDQVRVYFPTNQEADAYAVSAVSGYQPAAGNSKDPMGNPNVKYLKTTSDQAIQFAEDGIIINSGSGQATIYMKNSGVLEVFGSQNVNITATEAVVISAGTELLLGAQETVTLKNGGGASIALDAEGNIKLEGTKIFSN